VGHGKSSGHILSGFIGKCRRLIIILFLALTVLLSTQILAKIVCPFLENSLALYRTVVNICATNRNTKYFEFISSDS
jgi:hypothetical protein